ncbi:hypothetical protein IHQ71_10860 [Rhizobium sp. TH2]|uniref:hypothetical protein n=1 Tax=Rhizobium sp. TH2 TaxID=2775403 RepID=UPI00215769BF|nr:hypothetical protein [Rhizobium sp. TH2]UVC11031.1 hypothetical protein IHQ71_10860 [Rhizobium sp. TH2]
MREHNSIAPDRPLARLSASKKRSRSPDLGEPPIARLGSRVGMPRAIFNEDDDTTLGDLARIGRETPPMRRRGKVFGSGM